jgi:hypothetical protein
MDDINTEMDLRFEQMLDSLDDHEIDERREMRESLQ